MAGQQVTFVAAGAKQDRAPAKENAVSVDAGDNTPETEKEGDNNVTADAKEDIDYATENGVGDINITAEAKEDFDNAPKNAQSVDAGDNNVTAEGYVGIGTKASTPTAEETFGEAEAQLQEGTSGGTFLRKKRKCSSRHGCQDCPRCR
jgi:hypothetical protein